MADLVRTNLLVDILAENVKLDENVIAGEAVSDSIFQSSRHL
jgi:hypothetical protein